jgi:hypothetical protein
MWYNASNQACEIDQSVLQSLKLSRVQNVAAHCLARSSESLLRSVWHGVHLDCIRALFGWLIKHTRFLKNTIRIDLRAEQKSRFCWWHPATQTTKTQRQTCFFPKKLPFISQQSHKRQLQNIRLSICSTREVTMKIMWLWYIVACPAALWFTLTCTDHGQQ